MTRADRPSPITLCPRPCDRCRADDRDGSRRWSPCAHQAGHADGRLHECSAHRLDPTPATVAAAHALDDARVSAGLFRRQIGEDTMHKPISRLIRRRLASLLAVLALTAGAAVVFANPASAATVSKYCSAGDSGYRLHLIIGFTKASGKVDVYSVVEDFEHRTFGVWRNEDWASTSTDRYVVNGVIIKDRTSNPPQALDWNPGTAAQTYDPPVYVRTTASGSGTSVECRIDL